jgi:hypothetical protein
MLKRRALHAPTPHRPARIEGIAAFAGDERTGKIDRRKVRNCALTLTSYTPLPLKAAKPGTIMKKIVIQQYLSERRT